MRRAVLILPEFADIMKQGSPVDNLLFQSQPLLQIKDIGDSGYIQQMLQPVPAKRSVFLSLLQFTAAFLKQRMASDSIQAFHLCSSPSFYHVHPDSPILLIPALSSEETGS